MDTPKRQRILEAIRSRLEAIRTPEYATDAGDRVFVGEIPALGPDDPINAIAVVVGDSAPKYQAQHVFETVPIEVQAHVRVEQADTPYIDAETLLGDIVKAIESGDRTLGHLLKGTLEIGAIRTVPRDAGTTTIAIGITYNATYHRLWGQP